MANLQSLQDFQNLQTGDLTDDLRILLLPPGNAGPLEKAALSLADFRRLILNQPVPQAYIEGLSVTYNDGETLLVSSGECYIPGAGQLLQSSTAMPLVVPDGLTGSTHYYVYTYLENGTPSVELSDVEPADPYLGTARVKTGDLSRRLVGSVRTDANGSIPGFDILPGNFVMTRELTDAVNLVSAGTATVATKLDTSPFIPSFSRTVYLRAQNNGAEAPIAFMAGYATDPINQADLVVPAAPSNPNASGSVAIVYGFCRTDDQRNIAYTGFVSTSPPAAFAWANGYSFER